MSQATELIATLKRELKARGITYRAVAKALDQSEASVKRWFSRGSFNLDRVERICALAEMDFSDLVYAMKRSSTELAVLSEQQEQELISDEKLTVIAFLVINHWRFMDILQRYRFDEPELIRYLVRLDRLGIIELLPENRIRLRISPKFSWRKGGPIQQYFIRSLMEDYLQSPFDREDETFVVASGMLSPDAYREMLHRLERTLGEFHTENQNSRMLYSGERIGCSLMLALRPWRAKLFERYLEERPVDLTEQ